MTIGQRVSFIGINGPVTGIVVSLWEYHGEQYALVRDAQGGWHGYRATMVEGKA